MQEGRQASLAADFSITRFKHVGRLLMVHGRSSYKRSAALGQFVMHRGLIISTMQVRQSLPSNDWSWFLLQTQTPKSHVEALCAEMGFKTK